MLREMVGAVRDQGHEVPLTLDDRMTMAKTIEGVSTETPTSSCEWSALQEGKAGFDLSAGKRERPKKSP